MAVAACSVFGMVVVGFAIYWRASLHQTGHVRVSFSFLIFAILIAAATAWCVYDWARHK